MTLRTGPIDIHRNFCGVAPSSESLLGFGVVAGMAAEEVVIAGERPLDIEMAFVGVSHFRDRSNRFAEFAEVRPLRKQLFSFNSGRSYLLSGWFRGRHFVSGALRTSRM